MQSTTLLHRLKLMQINKAASVKGASFCETCKQMRTLKMMHFNCKSRYLRRAPNERSVIPMMRQWNLAKDHHVNENGHDACDFDLQLG